MTQTFRKTAILAAFATAAMGAAGAAMAQQGLQTRSMSMSPDLGWYGGLGLGNSKFDGACTGATGCDDKDSAWKLFGGYNFNRNLGLELGYHHLGSFSSSGPGFTANGEVTGWELTGVGRIPLTQQFSLFGKIGGFRWDRDVSVTGVGAGTGSDTGTDWTWGVGASYAFTPRISGRLEWQQFRDVGASGNDINALTASAVFKF